MSVPVLTLSRGARRASLLVLAAIVAVTTLVLLAGPALAADGGFPIWTRAVPGPDNLTFEKVAACPNGDIVAAGTVQLGSGYVDHVVISRYSAAGRLRWQHIFDPTNGRQRRPIDLAVDGLGNVIVACTDDHPTDAGYSEFLVFKYRDTGRFAWQRTFNGGIGGVNDPADLALDAAGNAYVTGRAALDVGVSGSLTVKLKASTGFPVWSRSFTGVSSLTDGQSLVVDGQGYVYVVGSGDRGDGIDEMIVVRLKPGGAPGWKREIPSASSNDMTGDRIALGPQGRLYVLGYERISGPEVKHCLVRFTTAGVEKWRDTYPDGSHFGWVEDLATDRYGNVFIGGQMGAMGPSAEPGFVVRWKPDKTRWVYESPDLGETSLNIAAMVPDQTGGCYVAGTYEVYPFTSQALGMGYLARLGAGGTLRWERLHTQVGRYSSVNDIALCSGGICAAGETWAGDGDGLVVKYRR